MVHEAHQKALAAVSTLEEEIERLNCTRAWSQSRAWSKSRDHWQQSREGQKKRCCHVWFEDQPAPSHSANPQTKPSEQGSNGRGSDLDELLGLKPTVASFLRGSLETSKDEGEETSLESLVIEFSRWVPWKAKRCETPEWWMELSAVTGKEDSRKLAREVRASFGLPWQLWELGSKEATLQAPLHHHVFADKSSCHQLTQFLLVGALGKSLGRKQWHMLGPSNIGQNNIVCLLEVSHDYWQKAYWSWGRRWNDTSPSLMKGSFRGWHSLRRKRRIVHRPFVLQMSPRHTVHLSLLWKGEPQSSWDGRKCYTHPNQWWLLGRSPNWPGPQGWKWDQANSPNDTNKTASLPSKDPYSTSALPANTSLGASVAANPAAWLLWSDGLFAYSRTCRGRPQSTSRCYFHQTSSNPWDLQCKFQPHCKGWDYRHNIYGHCHSLHWEDDP